MTTKKRLVLFGTSAFADLAYEYFTKESSYDVVGFTVERSHLTDIAKFGLPVVPFEELETQFPPGDYSCFVAVTYSEMNHFRERIASTLRLKNYELATFVSPHAFLGANVEIGDNCFIFENNTVQSNVRIGDNVIMWSGNHIGHHSTIAANCFVSSHCVIAGYVSIGSYTFLGVNSTISNNVVIGDHNWIGPGATLTASTDSDSIISAPKSILSRASAKHFFKVKC